MSKSAEEHPGCVHRLPPKHIAKRLSKWNQLFVRYLCLHYTFGIVSVTSASLAAAIGEQPGRFLAAVAGVCTAVLGFVQPERKYFKYVSAWRVLDVAAAKYSFSQTEITDLVEALERGEAIIGGFEDRDREPDKPSASSATTLGDEGETNS